MLRQVVTLIDTENVKDAEFVKAITEIASKYVEVEQGFVPSLNSPTFELQQDGSTLVRWTYED